MRLITKTHQNFNILSTLLDFVSVDASISLLFKKKIIFFLIELNFNLLITGQFLILDFVDHKRDNKRFFIKWKI